MLFEKAVPIASSLFRRPPEPAYFFQGRLSISRPSLLSVWAAPSLSDGAPLQFLFFPEARGSLPRLHRDSSSYLEREDACSSKPLSATRVFLGAREYGTPASRCGLSLMSESSRTGETPALFRLWFLQRVALPDQKSPLSTSLIGRSLLQVIDGEPLPADRHPSL